MASLKKDMLANIAGSMQDRSQGAIRGESPSPSPAPEPPGRSSITRQSEGRRRLESAALIRVDRIVADPKQPRVEFDQEGLERLAKSMRERGQLQPVRVRWDDVASRYVIVVGERRWRAAQRAGLENLACVVVAEDITPDDLLEDQLIENLLRDDLKPIEQARAFKSLLATRGLSQRQLAERLQISQATIAKALALLNLPVEIQTSVDAGAIGPDLAYELTKVADPAEQAELARGTAEGRIKRDELKERNRDQTRQQRGGSTTGKGAGKPKAKGNTRLPTERKYRGSRGVRLVVQTAARHRLEDVLADLEELVEQVRCETQMAAPDAA
jgi:ParB family chromosome partitioning protein